MCGVVVKKVRCEGEVVGSKNPPTVLCLKTVAICDFDGVGSWLTGGVLPELIIFCFLFLKSVF